MKHKQPPQNQNQTSTGRGRPTSAAALNVGAAAFVPAPAAVARRAYFTYVNQGSLAGHAVQHWLAAEAELIAEANSGAPTGVTIAPKIISKTTH